MSPMTLDPRLLEILVCPRCRGPLEYAEDENELKCPECRLKYRIEEDIPILLIDEAKPY